jgi:hypothetical protein
MVPKITTPTAPKTTSQSIPKTGGNPTQRERSSVSEGLDTIYSDRDPELPGDFDDDDEGAEVG